MCICVLYITETPSASQKLCVNVFEKCMIIPHHPVGADGPEAAVTSNLVMDCVPIFAMKNIPGFRC